MVIREFRCQFHDYEFESSEESPECPYGCHPKMVVREFRTPVGIKSDNTRAFDNLSRQMASDYNLSDIRGDKDGSSVMSNTAVRSGGAKIIDDKGPHWRPDFTVQPGWTGRGETAPTFKPPKDWTCAATPIQQIQKGARNYLQRATRYVSPKK